MHDHNQVNRGRLLRATNQDVYLTHFRLNILTKYFAPQVIKKVDVQWMLEK